MAIATEADISALCDKLSAAQDRVIELERTLRDIATIRREPESCGDLSLNGINDGKQRLITARYAVDTARKALGLTLHVFPGGK